MLTLLKHYMRGRHRGRTRLPMLAARYLGSLQTVPIFVEDCAPFYVDLRDPAMHAWFIGSPWATAPVERWATSAGGEGERALMRRIVRPGQVVYDIGANVGAHTVLLSRLVGPTGRVVAFEANPQRAACLRRTVAGLRNTELHNVALADESGAATLFVPDDHAMTSLANWTGLPVRTLTCQRRRLDDIGAPPPDFIKCDVEGGEAAVFRGARRLLDRPTAPTILFETIAQSAAAFGEPADAASDVLLSLPQAGYRCEQFSAAMTLAVPAGRDVGCRDGG